jgi:hypothetical protein
VTRGDLHRLERTPWLVMSVDPLHSSRGNRPPSLTEITAIVVLVVLLMGFALLAHSYGQDALTWLAGGTAVTLASTAAARWLNRGETPLPPAPGPAVLPPPHPQPETPPARDSTTG